MPERRKPCSDGSSADLAPDETLDLRGLKCPLPVLHTRRALARVAAGAVLEVRCTDPLSAVDIPNLVRETGNILLLGLQHEGEARFHIRKAGEPRERAALAAEDPSGAAGVDETR